jgi:hypothetical protein
LEFRLDFDHIIEKVVNSPGATVTQGYHIIFSIANRVIFSISTLPASGFWAINIKTDTKKQFQK